MQYVSYTLVAFTAFSGLLLNYIAVSAKLALATLQQDEYDRLRAREARFKTIAAVFIWAGTAVIVVQMMYYAFKFCRKHGAQVRRLGSRAQSAMTRLASRASSSQASASSQSTSPQRGGDMELSMVGPARRNDSTDCEAKDTGAVSQDAAPKTLQQTKSPWRMNQEKWQPNLVTNHDS